MKILKIIILTITTIVSAAVVFIWLYSNFGPIRYGGCFDSTKDIGWPLPAFTTSGVYQTCGDGAIAAQWHVVGFALDIIVIATFCYWGYLLFKKIKGNK